MKAPTLDTATPFMRAASADFDAGAGVVEVEIGGQLMPLHYTLASASGIDRARKIGGPSEIRMNAALVRDHVTTADGAPIVPRSEEGLRFLLENVRPALLGRLALLVAGRSEAELGES